MTDRTTHMAALPFGRISMAMTAAAYELMLSRSVPHVINDWTEKDPGNRAVVITSDLQAESTIMSHVRSEDRCVFMGGYPSFVHTVIERHDDPHCQLVVVDTVFNCFSRLPKEELDVFKELLTRRLCRIMLVVSPEYSGGRPFTHDGLPEIISFNRGEFNQFIVRSGELRPPYFDEDYFIPVDQEVCKRCLECGQFNLLDKIPEEYRSCWGKFFIVNCREESSENDTRVSAIAFVNDGRVSFFVQRIFGCPYYMEHFISHACGQ